MSGRLILSGDITTLAQRRFLVFLRIMIGSVWVFHGVYSKLLNGVPRHQAILGQVLGVGPDISRPAILAVGVMETSLGLWAWSGRFPRACMVVQTLAIIGMNTLEICFARDLLISAPGMVALNIAFLALGWYGATRKKETDQAGSQPA